MNIPQEQQIIALSLVSTLASGEFETFNAIVSSIEPGEVRDVITVLASLAYSSLNEVTARNGWTTTEVLNLMVRDVLAREGS